MQSFKWKDNLPKLIIEQKYNLKINLDGTSQSIPYIPPNKMRILVGVETNPSNINKEILNLMHLKTQGYLATLTSCTLSPSDIMEGCDKFWWPSIKCMAPVLTLEPAQNMLQPFYRRLLPRIKINRNLPSALIPILFYIGGFNIRSLEME